VLEVLAREIMQQKKIKRLQIRMTEVKLSLIADPILQRFHQETLGSNNHFPAK
jgi:hypothetical protein